MARCPFATWTGPIPNQTKGQMYGHYGLVLHIIGVAHMSSADNWFHNPKAQASAHFGVRKDGELLQWVDTDDTAWAEMAGNHLWVSVENESQGEPLTQAQVETNAKLLAWLHKLYGFPLQLSQEPAVHGLGHHSMGGASWGNHPYCPGHQVLSQKPEILHRARALGDFPVEEPKQDKSKPVKADTPDWFTRTLSFPVPASKPGAVKGGRAGFFQVGADVEHVQRKLHVKVDGWFGEDTVKKVRGFQTTHKLRVDGVVGPVTAKAIG